MEGGIGIASAYIGAALAVGVAAVGTGTGLGYAAREAARGMARQPGYSGSLLKSMLLGQAMTETPTIFALVVGLLLVFRPGQVATTAKAVALVGSGLAIGIGALGSGYGSGFVAGRAVAAQASNPSQSTNATFIMFIAQAMAQTPVIFALLISLLLLFWDLGYEEAVGLPGQLVLSAKVFGAAVAMGAGAIGPAWGTANAGGSAVEAASRFPENSGIINRTMLIGMGVSQTTSIYSLLIAVLLLRVA